MKNPIAEQIPPEPKLPYRLHFSGLEHHATALGYICITFANLEFTLDTFLTSALKLSDDEARAIIKATGKFENRCTLLIELIYANCKDKEWAEALEEFINQNIKADIAPERNRLIHDAWIAGSPPKQWLLQAKLGRPNAGDKKQILPKKEIKRELATMWDLVRRVQICDASLSQFSAFYSLWWQQGRPLELPQL